MKNINNMMKQAKKMQSDLSTLEKDFDKKIVNSSVGGGMIKISANGSQKITSIQISEEIIKQKDNKVLEDLMLIAVNDVLNKSKEMASNEMKKITGGINIPG